MAPEFYVWRQYILRTGTQPRRLAEFLQGAAIPALNRLGHSPIGVFEVTFGLPTPTVFVLTPSSSLESLLAIEAGLERDDVFMKAASPYLDAPATDAGLRATGAVTPDGVPQRPPHRGTGRDRNQRTADVRAAHV